VRVQGPPRAEGEPPQEEGSNTDIDRRNFDAVVCGMAEEQADFIVDIGASAYFEITAHLDEAHGFELLMDAGKELHAHSVIAGSTHLVDTLRGFDALAKFVPQGVRPVVWLNEYFGRIESEGKVFERMAVHERHRERISAPVRLARPNMHTLGRDLETMGVKKLTFDEALRSPDFNLVERQRITFAQRDILAQLAQVV
jgi:hypothetical protein